MADSENRVQLIARAREFIQAHGQVPRTEHLSSDPDRAAWELLGQVLDVADVLAEQGRVMRPFPPGGEA